MGQNYAIHRVAAAMGLTSRTLRHWEGEGLLKSGRDPQSGWRVYDEETLGRIRFILLMRALDIPVRGIRAVLDSGDPREAGRVIASRIERLEGESRALERRKTLLEACLAAVKSLDTPGGGSLQSLEQTLALKIGSPVKLEKDWEASVMTSINASTGTFRIITLPAMRLAVCNVVSASPEDEALNGVVSWAEEQGLLGTARIFGFNTTEYKPGQAEYGWAASVTVPEGVDIPAHLMEKRVPGGLYAMLASTNEIYDSWQALVRQINESGEVEADHSRMCFEEHIRNGNPKGSGNEYYLNLLEPIKRK